MNLTQQTTLIDTHAHINMMVKKEFDVLLTPKQLTLAKDIIRQSQESSITTLINVGTSLPESKNCIALAKKYTSIYATVGLHPNDCTQNWRTDLQELENDLTNKKQNKIVGIGECGMDFHYPDYNVQRQRDAFKAQIELALKHNIGLIVHTRDAGQETLRVIEEFKNDITRGIIHCFSEDQSFANTIIDWGFVLGIGGTITYKKNDALREIVRNASLDKIVLETDAPFLPPQHIRGKQNHPQEIKTIAQYIAQLKQIDFTTVAQKTTTQAQRIFNITS